MAAKLLRKENADPVNQNAELDFIYVEYIHT